jgi:hypothetical protein
VRSLVKAVVLLLCLALLLSGLSCTAAESAPSDTTPTIEILSDTSYVASDNTYHLEGEVKNTGTQAATWVLVIANFYDEEETAVCSDWHFSSPRDLAPGQTASFNFIVTDKAEVRKISSYELQVDAD